jgi:Na+-transporting methylmalonyl-CoA/oxaloacetate decarboxylase beta subunit
VKEQIRVLLITSKVLQFCADIFAVFGIFLFAYIYFQHFQADPMSAIKNPAFVVILLVPFIPAAVMAYLASQKRRKIRQLLEQAQK